MYYHCKVIVLMFGNMMGMRVFVWLRMVVSFYAPFSPWQGKNALNSALLTLQKRGIWPTIEATRVVFRCLWEDVQDGQGVSLVVVGPCGGDVFLEPARGFCGGWNVQNGWKSLDSP